MANIAGLLLLLLSPALLLLPSPSFAQRPRPPPPSSKTCVQDGKTECPKVAPFTYATIVSDDTYIYVNTTQCPPYAGAGWSNPAQACEFDNTYRIPLNPRKANKTIPVGEKLSVYDDITYLKEDPKPIMGVMGVLLNGVNVFGVGSPCGYSSKCPSDGGPSLYVDAVDAEGYTVDGCGGHPAPTHQYHVHSGIGMVTSELRETCGLPVDTANSHSELLGYMFDGYGLYGKYSLNGEPNREILAS